MATTRKDLRGRTLRKGEMQRSSDKRYAYSYTDPLGRRKYIYANDLVTLREKEAQLTKDQMDGLDIYFAGKATVNFVFDRYMSLKTNLRQTTRSNYLYMYDRFIRDTFGKKKIAEIRYSDVLQFYNYLLDKQGLQANTLESVHTLLHPTFQLAVRDEIVRKNPTDGVMAEIKKSSEQTTGVRHALTIPQQRAAPRVAPPATRPKPETTPCPKPFSPSPAISQAPIPCGRRPDANHKAFALSFSVRGRSSGGGTSSSSSLLSL